MNESSHQEESASELATRLGEIEGVSDSTAEFLARNWQRFVSFGIFVLIGVFLYDQYQVSQATRFGEASHKFLSVQRMYKTLLAEEGELEEDVQRPFRDSVDVLSRSYSGSIYSDLAPLYLELLERRVGATTELSQFISSKTGPTIGKKTLLSELASLLQARKSIDSGNLQEGVQKLKALSKSAILVSGEAVLVLLRIASTEEQVEEAKQLAQDLVVRRPELGEMIKAQFAEQGHELS